MLDCWKRKKKGRRKGGSPKSQKEAQKTGGCAAAPFNTAGNHNRALSVEMSYITPAQVARWKTHAIVGRMKRHQPNQGKGARVPVPMDVGLGRRANLDGVVSQYWVPHADPSLLVYDLEFGRKSFQTMPDGEDFDGQFTIYYEDQQIGITGPVAWPDWYGNILVTKQNGNGEMVNLEAKDVEAVFVLGNGWPVADVRKRTGGIVVYMVYKLAAWPMEARATGKNHARGNRGVPARVGKWQTKRCGPTWRLGERIMFPVKLATLNWERNFILRAGLRAVHVDEKVLSRGSAVFRDLFKNAPLRPPASFTVIALNDESEDVLRYIDKVYNVDAVPHTPITLDVLGSLLEMGRKYDDNGVFNEMSCIVAKEFPRTLKEWDAAAKAPFTAISWTAGVEFDLITLANTFDLFTALPSLWYRICCNFTPGTYHEPCVFADGLWRTQAQRRDGVKRSNGYTARLTNKQQLLCAVGEHRLAVAERTYTLKWLDLGEIPVSGCRTVKRCQAFVLRTGVEVVGRGRPIAALAGWNDNWNGNMCAKCQRHAKKTHDWGRREVWKRLPRYFDLYKWKDAAEWQKELVSPTGIYFGHFAPEDCPEQANRALRRSL
ncbi:hypothetical protein FPV67DRAFT_1460747 [Lyophyllum atratum]|nr:hypothetical protein FPV67DRAFT_1460747 [Lyophyllum atratum]